MEAETVHTRLGTRKKGCTYLDVVTAESGHQVDEVLMTQLLPYLLASLPSLIQALDTYRVGGAMLAIVASVWIVCHALKK
jgi:hypothetical protein